MSLRRLPDSFTLGPTHPFAGRAAYQCSVCDGISYTVTGECPYCAEESSAEMYRRLKPGKADEKGIA